MSNARIKMMRSIMKTAWALFRKGIVTMSMSLKVAWRVVRHEVDLSTVYKQLKRGADRRR